MYIVIFVTASNKKEAKAIAKALLKKKLVACVNIVDQVESWFWWDKKIDRAQELLLIAKSNTAKLPQIIKCVKSLHSYTVPEIIALPIIAGNQDYLNWINASLK